MLYAVSFLHTTVQVSYMCTHIQCTLEVCVLICHHFVLKL